MTRSPEDLVRLAKHQMSRVLGGAAVATSPRLGKLNLRPHQITAADRLREIMGTHRGALLADAVGLGKTYVALAVARECENALIICPAALRSMWERATAAAGLTIPIASIEALSRGLTPVVKPDLVIVDEAHHLRTPGTRRYEAVAHLAHRARLLLVSATPLHNSRRDLTSLLALFAGSVVKDWSDEAVARLIVRRVETADQSLPTIVGPESLSPGADDDCLDAILAIPPAIPTADEGVAHALATISLLHLWTSSRAALVASIRRRVARATALRDAVASGHMPTAAELSAWRFADDALQLAFPLFARDDNASLDAEALAEQLDRFVNAGRALVESCRRTVDPDDGRVRLLRTLRLRHPGARIVAFSQYAHTVTALGRLMRADPGIAVVTADGARIASGPIPREEVLAQLAFDAAAVHAAERIDVVLTTDLLSEGIDLRGASVIVHLDLPWNPARMEQRVGRSRRAGSSFKEIYVYTFVPPTAAERMLELERRLSSKVRAARTVIGGGFDPFGSVDSASASPVATGEALRARIGEWVDPFGPDDDEHVAIGSVSAPISGWLAVVTVEGVPRVIADLGSGVSDDARTCLTAVAMIDAGEPTQVKAGEQLALKQTRDWMAARSAAAIAGICPSAKRAVLERLTRAVARAPRHRRPAVVAGAQRSRAVLAGVSGVGVERVLNELARSPSDDHAWLQAVDSFCSLHSDDSVTGRPGDRIVAVILLGNPELVQANHFPGSLPPGHADIDGAVVEAGAEYLVDGDSDPRQV